MDRFNELIDKYKLPIGLSLVGIVLIIGGIFSSNLPSLPSIKPKAPPKVYPKESLVDPKTTVLKVDVSGAVNTPGVYTLVPDSRMEDLVVLAGGFTNLVNKEFVAKSLNLSQKVTDGMKVYIPFEGEETSTVKIAATTSTNTLAASTTNSALIGLNTATDSLLDTLPGVGPATIKKLVDGRPYSDINELLSKKVVGKATFDKIKDLVDLN